MKLLIVRHADPDYSIDSLTETGRKEAELLARRLARLSIHAVYCSPLGRAQDTAKPTLKGLNQQAGILPWLREFSPRVVKPHKDTPGVVWDWMPRDWTAEPRFYDPEKWCEPSIFADAHVQEAAREVAEGLDALLASHGYVREGRLYRAEQPNEKTILLFCHFGVECVLLSHLLGISPMPLWHGTCALPTSVTTLVTEERQEGIASFRMLSFGDLAHLYAAEQDPSFAARFCETYNNWDQRH